MASNNDIVVDPNFFFPPGIIDMRYEQKDIGITNDSNTAPNQSAELFGSAIPVDYTLNATPVEFTSNSLLPPPSFIVISQNVKLDTSGKSVVDVVIEVPDINGVTQIGARMTKI